MNRALLVCLFAFSWVPSALGFQLRLDSSGHPVHWASRADFVLDADAAVQLGEPNTLSAVQRALSTYVDAVPEIAFSLREGHSRGIGYDARPGARNESDIVVLQDWSYDPAAIAITVVTVDTRAHHILDADIALNGQSRQFKDLSGIPWQDGEHDDIQNTLTHELGHALGLAHNPADRQVVMFPSAFRGEISKRTLASDDRAGLSALYPSSSGPAAAGCSASPSGSGAWAVLSLLFLATLRRRWALTAAVAALFALPAAGSEGARRPARASQAAAVATVEVLRARTSAPIGPSIWTTEVEVKVRNCLKGSCPDQMVVTVPGGRQGDLEQWVDGRAPLSPGAMLGVTLAPNARTEAPRGHEVEVFHLELERDFAAFSKALSAAGLPVDALRGSPPTRR